MDENNERDKCEGEEDGEKITTRETSESEGRGQKQTDGDVERLQRWEGVKKTGPSCRQFRTTAPSGGRGGDDGGKGGSRGM